MEVFRIAKDKYIKDLTGTGAKLFGGRWNPKGCAILYTSITRSLAALEYLIHLDPKTIPENLQIATIEIPEKYISKFNYEEFIKISGKKNATLIFKHEGKNWIDSNDSLALEVPSILIPEEKNILINPEHKSISQVVIRKVEPFKFDERFFI